MANSFLRISFFNLLLKLTANCAIQSGKNGKGAEKSVQKPHNANGSGADSRGEGKVETRGGKKFGKKKVKDKMYALPLPLPITKGRNWTFKQASFQWRYNNVLDSSSRNFFPSMSQSSYITAIYIPL